MRRNIKMRVTREQSESVQDIVKAHGAEMVFLSNEVNAISFGDTLAVFNFYDMEYGGEYGFALLPFEEIDTDLFIRTNGTCEEVEYTSSPTSEDIVVRVTEDQAKQIVAGHGVKLDVIPEPKGHPHAELMAEYAKDAAETDRPWERWEARIGSEKPWVNLYSHPSWNKEMEFRRKPQRRTVTMPDGTVLPEPVREALGDGEDYWVVTFGYEDTIEFATETVADCVWYGNEYDNLWLKQGLIHRTEEDAKAWAEYLLKLTKGV